MTSLDGQINNTPVDLRIDASAAASGPATWINKEKGRITEEE